MKKDTLRGIAVLAVLLILYVLIAFVIPFAHTATFWVSFVFTLIAFAVMAASVYIAFIKNPDAKSRFYGFPIAKIGAIYGAVQLMASVLFMALGKWLPVWVAVVVYAVALGAALVSLVSAETVASEIQIQNTKLKKDVTLMHSLQSKVSKMAAQSENAAVKALAEELHYSDPVSNDLIADVEAELASAVDELQAAYANGDNDAVAKLCQKAMVILEERNRLCKRNKT